MELEPEMSSSSYSENYEPRLSASTTTCSTGSSKRSRFTPQQRTILNSYYLMGMVGTGKVHSFRIERAAKKVECSFDKIKLYFTVCPSDAMYKNTYSFNYCSDILVLLHRWIKKRNRRMKQARTGDINEVVPEAKRVKLTPWQAYMKDLGKSDGMY